MLLAESPIATVILLAGDRWLWDRRDHWGVCPRANLFRWKQWLGPGAPVARANPSESRPALCQGRTNPTIRCRRLQCALFGVPWLKPTNFVKEHVNEILVGQGFCWLANLLQVPRVGLIFYQFYEMPSRNVHRKLVPSHALQDEHHRRRGDVIAAL